MKGIIEHYIVSIYKIEKEINRKIKKERAIMLEINKLDKDFTFDEIYRVCELL